MKGRLVREMLDAHRLSQFIYGTVTGLVAVAAIDAGSVVEWWKAVLVVLVRSGVRSRARGPW